VIVASGKVEGKIVKHTDIAIMQQVEKPLDFIRWFEPSSIGMEVTLDKKAMRVGQVLEKSYSATAGLRKGDLIQKVDDKPFDSVDAFRRLLRRGSIHDFCKLTIERESKTLEI
jgi:S1-C subfamily serine protease